MGDGVHILWAKIRAIWGKSDLDDDFNEELEAHLDLLTAEYEKAGMKPQEARRAAILKVGGRETLREENRDARGLPFLEVLSQAGLGFIAKGTGLNRRRSLAPNRAFCRV